MNAPWVCRACRLSLKHASKSQRRWISKSPSVGQQMSTRVPEDQIKNTRNIGIIAHIDAGKTTTTERMLYYSGFTRRIGDVDEGTTVTDFLPAERARGITIQSAAITLHWPSHPPEASSLDPVNAPNTEQRHTINLIDTPGHADFTFEVIRSLRILDGAVCILDGVAGVEAQTEKVWHQANNYRIPRIIYVNKLDRDGAAFNRTVKEIASRLHTFPALCEIPWWRDGKFVGVADVVGLRALLWPEKGDGATYQVYSWDEIENIDSKFRDEMRKARAALIEALTEQDENMVESFLEAEEDLLAIPPSKVWESLRKCLLDSNQALTPVFAGASFRNIGVQPLLSAVNALLPSPSEAPDPDITLDRTDTTLRSLLSTNGDSLLRIAPSGKAKNRLPQASAAAKGGAVVDKLTACALAFKVVNDTRRGVLVYVRVYHGILERNNMTYNTSLSVSERAMRLLRVHASETVEIDSIEAGQIGVIAGLKHARTGDTLLVYTGSSPKHPPPAPIDRLQLRPIDVPPPLFFTSIEPHSLSEEKNLKETMDLLLREDPSLHVLTDPESGQTHLSGMGELHLEIARDRLINDFKVKATMGKIEISYRETLTAASEGHRESFDREIAGKATQASCMGSVAPIDKTASSSHSEENENTQIFDLRDSNKLTIHHPNINLDGKPLGDSPALPPTLPLATIFTALQTGATAALARGPLHNLPVHSTSVVIKFDQASDVTPTTSAAALTAAARQAIQAALKSASQSSPTVLMEPVMLATIAVPEDAMGSVVHDLNSARGGHVLSLDVDDADAEVGVPASDSQTPVPTQAERLSTDQLNKVYAPPDPFGESDVGGSASRGHASGSPPRQIRARVPLKEMVGYLKHLRSMTGGRGTFVMSVDTYERMSAQRQRLALEELGASIA